MSTSTNDDRERTCDLTNTPMINDCYVRITFGYDSELNRHTYRFSTCDKVGQQIIQYINTLYTNGKTIDDHVHVDPDVNDPC